MFKQLALLFAPQISISMVLRTPERNPGIPWAHITPLVSYIFRPLNNFESEIEVVTVKADDKTPQAMAPPGFSIRLADVAMTTPPETTQFKTSLKLILSLNTPENINPPVVLPTSEKRVLQNAKLYCRKVPPEKTLLKAGKNTNSTIAPMEAIMLLVYEGLLLGIPSMSSFGSRMMTPNPKKAAQVCTIIPFPESKQYRYWRHNIQLAEQPITCHTMTIISSRSPTLPRKAPQLINTAIAEKRHYTTIYLLKQWSIVQLLSFIETQKVFHNKQY